jgi:hypothetical protein
MSKLSGVVIACAALIIQSSAGMALQQTPEALKCRAAARAHAKICMSTDPKRLHPEKVYSCASKGAADFRRCCDRTPHPADCKSQIAQ